MLGVDELRWRCVQALAEMQAKDEGMALQAQHDAAKNARVVMAAEAARAAAEVDAALLRRELQQAAALRAARAQQRLRTLAERAAAATAAAVTTERDARSGAAERRSAAALGRAASDRAAAGSAAAAREERVETELERLARGACCNPTALQHEAIPTRVVSPVLDMLGHYPAEVSQIGARAIKDDTSVTQLWFLPPTPTCTAPADGADVVCAP